MCKIKLHALHILHMGQIKGKCHAISRLGFFHSFLSENLAAYDPK
jgi:hypothetical protein